MIVSEFYDLDVGTVERIEIRPRRVKNSFFGSDTWNLNEVGGQKVKSAYEPSGPSGRRLSWFQQHEVTRSISNPPWMGC